MKALFMNNLVKCVLICSVVCLGGVEKASADLFTDANLVGFWQFNGGANDNSGTGNHGTLNGDASVSADILVLDGTGDYVNIGNDSSLKPSLPVSVSMWVRPDNLGTTQMLIRNDDPGAYPGTRYYGVWSHIETNSKIQVTYGDGGFPEPASRRTKVSTSTLSEDQWQHVVLVVSGATDMDIYIDGADAGGTYSGSGSALTYSAGDGAIGAHGFASFTTWLTKDAVVSTRWKAQYLETRPARLPETMP
jgi:hypothetical protein